MIVPAVPEYLVCRYDEFAEIRGFIDGKLREGAAAAFTSAEYQAQAKPLLSTKSSGNGAIWLIYLVKLSLFFAISFLI